MLANKNQSKKIINKRESQFKNYAYDEDNYCLVKIKIEDIEYIESKKIYYYISYDYKFGDKSNMMSHPFFGNKEMLENNYEGEIIVKNELSKILIEFLLMDENNLKDKTGFTTTYNYRSSIMKMITHIWD